MEKGELQEIMAPPGMEDIDNSDDSNQEN